MLTLNLSAAEAQVVTAALDCYIRTHLGQPEHALDSALMQIDDLDKLKAIRTLLQGVQILMTGIPNGGPSITNPNVPNKARIARRIQAIIIGDESALNLYNQDGSVR